MRRSARNPRQAVAATALRANERRREHAGTNACTAYRYMWLLLATSLLVLLALAATQLTVTLRHQPPLNLTCPPVIVPHQLPCQALPLGFIEQHPDCANALLGAMNVTNVHVLTYEEMVARSGEVRRGIGQKTSSASGGVPASVATPLPVAPSNET